MNPLVLHLFKCNMSLVNRGQHKALTKLNVILPPHINVSPSPPLHLLLLFCHPLQIFYAKTYEYFANFFIKTKLVQSAL